MVDFYRLKRRSPAPIALCLPVENSLGRCIGSSSTAKWANRLRNLFDWGRNSDLAWKCLPTYPDLRVTQYLYKIYCGLWSWTINCSFACFFSNFPKIHFQGARIQSSCAWANPTIVLAASGMQVQDTARTWPNTMLEVLKLCLIQLAPCFLVCFSSKQSFLDFPLRPVFLSQMIHRIEIHWNDSQDWKTFLQNLPNIFQSRLSRNSSFSRFYSDFSRPQSSSNHDAKLKEGSWNDTAPGELVPERSECSCEQYLSWKGSVLEKLLCNET